MNDKNEALATNYLQLCGTLAGLCGAFIVALLSPGLFPSGSSEITIILLLFAGFGYTYTAARSALMPSVEISGRPKLMRHLDTIFLFSNVVLWLAFSSVLYVAGHIGPFVVSLVLTAVAAYHPILQAIRSWRA